MATTVVILKPGQYFKFCCLLLTLLVLLEFVFNFIIHYNIAAGISVIIQAVLPQHWSRPTLGHHHNGRETTLNVNLKPPCPSIPPHLEGPIKVHKKALSFQQLEYMNQNLQPGGHWSPSTCESQHHIAVVVAYRDRRSHLKIFLRNIHPFLQKQQLNYGIYVIELVPEVPFNRAMLFNIGFVESVKHHNFSCFIFHDVDLIPENDRNLYICNTDPQHLSVAIDKYNYRLPYSTIFGGVSALTRDHFTKINGFSNKYFGWGGEDDDMFRRIQSHNFSVVRYSSDIARYKMLAHAKNIPNPKRIKLLKEAPKRFHQDGINSLKYKIVKMELRKLFTWILVDINPADIMKEDINTTPLR